MSSTREESSIADQQPCNAGQARSLMPIRSSTRLRYVTVSQCSGMHTDVHFLEHTVWFVTPCKVYCIAFCTPDLRGTASTMPPAFLSHQSTPLFSTCSRTKYIFPCLASYIETSATTKGLRVHLVERDIVPVNSGLSILSYNFKQVLKYT